MAPSAKVTRLIFIVTLTLMDQAMGHPSGDTSIQKLPSLSNEGAGSPTLMDLFKNFNVTERIPDSAFQRFLVHLGRVLIVALVVCLWILLVIQFFVCTGKCCQGLGRWCFGKGKGSTLDAEESLTSSSIFTATIKKSVGKQEEYQKNYVNRTHSMPILVFKK